MSIADKINSIFLNVLSAARMNSTDYCDIETIDGYSTIVMQNNSMMTFVKYDGLLSTIKPEVFTEMVEGISNELNALMKHNGYKIACVFRKDLDAQSSLKKTELQQKQTTRNLNLNLDDLIEENTEVYRNSVYDEEVYFALITQPSVMDQVERDGAAEQRMAISSPALPTAQNILSPIEVLRSKHTSFVEKFMAAISNQDYYVKADVMNCLTGLAMVRHQVIPDRSDKTWLPSVAIGEDVADKLGYPGYQTPICWPINSNPHDLSYLFPPSLPKQIMSNGIRVIGAKEGVPPYTVATGGRLFSSVVMNIPPSQPAIFDALFNAFNQSSSIDADGNARTMPWSITYMISGDGMAGSTLKAMVKDIFARVPPVANENLQASYNQLSRIKRANTAIVGFQVSAMTWVEDTPEGRRKLRNRKTRLFHIMESWGGMNVIENLGDPILSFQSNILGLSDNHHGPKGAAPLARVVELLPWTRPASPFDSGSVLQKTLDGKLMRYEKFSSNQNTWVSCAVGTPGSGKSVYMNNMLTETCMMPGLERLPLITIIDKGISSTGFINLISDALPNNMKYLAVSKKLRKTKEYAINPLDIKVGLTKPLEAEKNQMVSFLTALLTPAENTSPYASTQAFVNYLIERVFDAVQEDTTSGNPKMHAYGYNKELDNIIDAYNIITFQETKVLNSDGTTSTTIDREKFEKISSFGLTRLLHIEGERYPAGSDERIDLWRARDLAHRTAMPILLDLVSILNDPTTASIYKNEIDTGESMIGFAQRTISEVSSIYPCFSNFTQFDVDSARIVALDLQEVLDKNNRWQSSLFLQIARMIGVKKLSLTEEDLIGGRIPDVYLSYYRSQLRNLETDRKVLAIDEMHNAKGDKALMKLLETDAREGRKWGLELMFASQNLTDFDFGEGEDRVQLLSYVTNLVVASQPKANDLESFTKYFTDNPAVLEQMPRIGLSRDGLTFMSYIVAKTNSYCALITSTVGDKRLWSLTTDQDDRLIRTLMIKIAGNRQLAIAALAYYFPGGARSRIKEIRETVDSSPNISKEELEERTSGQVEMLAHQALAAYEAERARRRLAARQAAA